ncbi:MAG: DUF4855 domain-containing protein [Limnochordales bacterium]|nr:DUF4855 domain-containing protein [Limnochordales bacterium]
MRSFPLPAAGAVVPAAVFTAIVVLAMGVGTRAKDAVATTATNLALGRPYTISAYWPDPLFTEMQKAYPDTEGKELTDGKKASVQYSDPGWQVFTRQAGRRIQVDLGKLAVIKEVRARFLQSRSVGVYVPRRVTLYTSADGQKWVHAGEQATQVGPWNPRVQVEEFSFRGLDAEPASRAASTARYVAIEFPVDVMVFMDELEVFGVPLSEEEKAAYVPAGAVANVPMAVPMPREEVSPEHPAGYAAAGSPAAAGARHIVLATYAYPPNETLGRWTARDYLPYVAYLSEDGKPQDWMFDSILLAPQGSTPSGRGLVGDKPGAAANMEDWQWLLDETFMPGHQLDALQEAAHQAKQALGDPDYKVKVFLTLVYPSPFQNAFGDLDGDGVPESFAWSDPKVGPEKALENRVAAVKWLLDEYLRRWQEKQYPDLELVGFWWHRESILFQNSPNDDELVRQVADLVHQAGYKFIWIPYYGAAGSYDWWEYGFDAAILQPNYMFADVGRERLELAARIARTLGMGIEMEKHWLGGWNELQKWIDYLAAGVEQRYMQEAVIGYYQNYKDFGEASHSDIGTRRLYYDFVYQFIKGTYVPIKLPGMN